MWWEITDNDGTIYSGSEEEMQDRFNEMVSQDESPEVDEPECGWCGDYDCEYCEGEDQPDEPEVYEWDGDLRLIHVVSIHR